MCGRAIHITHWVCKKSVPFLRTDKIGYFRASNSRWHAVGMLSWAGSSKDLANDALTINNNQMQTKTVFGEVTRQTLPTTACSGHVVFGRVCSGSLRTTNIHTKTQSIIFMQWGWELSQQWSSGEFRQIKVCNQKGQKGQHWATRSPTQTWIPLGKLEAFYNFAAWLFCTAQSLFRTILDQGGSLLSQSCKSCAAAFAVEIWAQMGQTTRTPCLL